MKKIELSFLNFTMFALLIFTSTLVIAQAPSAIVWDMAVGCENKTDVYVFAGVH